jgi:hypothetical protein
MGFRTFRRMRVLAVSLATVTVTATLFAVALAAGPASAATGNGCPASKTLGSLATADNVAAGFSNAGNTTTYTFSSPTNENPTGGVPGLMKYCVYPSPVSQPTDHHVLATGANGAQWVFAKGSNNFAFVRPGGNKTNIPLDGNTTTMGDATWSKLPDSQKIILHINDPTVCTSLYGSGTPGTCFVKPSTGPICDNGDTNAAYNSMPTDVVNCLNPAIGFEATSTSEFGDQVGLAGGAGQNLVSLKVDFQSFACESGHWYDAGGCSSAAGAAFTHPITANIYDPSDLLNPIATVTQTQTIPYRPSSNASCPANAGGAPAGAAWFNPLAPNGGACQNSIGTVLTFNNFTFPGGPTLLPATVVWTVAFNTTHYGAAPIGEGASCFVTSGGCAYDSLNVGDRTYSGAPYAGTDTDPNGAFLSSTWTGAYCDNGAGGTGTLRLDTPCWTPFRPLGEIITTP